MRNALARAFNQITERPGWQQYAVLLAGYFGFVWLLYFLMLKAPLQEQHQGQEHVETLRQNVSDQQHRLLLQPPLAELLRQQALLAPVKTEDTTLMEKITGALHQSAGSLLQWQPGLPNAVHASTDKKGERGILTLRTDYKDFLALLRRLLNDPAAPVLSNLQLHVDKTLLNITFSLTTDSRPSPISTTLPSADAVSRDPFSSQAIEICTHTRDAFKHVILGGVIGDAVHQRGWILWPGLGWLPASVGWRDAQSGWQVVAVEARQVRFDLQQPLCAAKQHTLALLR
ncbi:MAG: hypothetical protein ACOH2G_15180 [Ewingella sp.]